MSGFDINSVTVSGNLTRDPEVRNLPSGQAVCSLRIAHNERFKDASGEWADRAAYFDVTIWSGLGEWMGRNLTKGQKVVVSGRLRWREWETPGGDKRQAVDINADSVVPVVRDGDARGGGGSSNGYQARSDVPADMSDFQQPAAVGGGGGRQSADDDIPF
ncbi:MAG TPA: single-stranded DNA-binding protein [Solirubrobacteraceae bacterium]|nr:single-stranded DNA-binding protein [Solirubrobacteraceae bacterium]